MKRALHWFRRDLRLHDNTALRQAVDAAEEVIPVYIISEWKGEHRWTGPSRQEFLCQSLAELAMRLEQAGGKLIFRQGNAVRELALLVKETNAEAVYFNRDPDPFGREVEEELARVGEAQGFAVKACKDACLHERDEVLTGSAEPYRVFTPYSRAWAKVPKDKPVARVSKLRTPGGIRCEPMPTLATWRLTPGAQVIAGGEEAARKRMAAFVSSGLASYGAVRDRLDFAGTSRLSQDLRYGLISIRELYERCREKMETQPAAQRDNASKYVGELIWREFYQQILWHYPEVLEDSFNPKFRGMRWKSDPAGFERWCAGQTGFPVVDAAMRQLAQTGFMHNRARMITAMFLTKDLHIDWREGEAYFMRQLTDGEIASNNGGWQWSAGTGADAAPYFRIQNPWTQSARFDPDAAYIKHWVPELRDLPAEKLHVAPASGLRIARNYPAPMVDHATERERTLEMFAKYQGATAPR